MPQSPVEKAAPFSTLRRYDTDTPLGQPPLPLGEGWGEGAPHADVPGGKGCAVFHATALIAAMGRSCRGIGIRRSGPWPRSASPGNSGSP